MYIYSVRHHHKGVSGRGDLDAEPHLLLSPLVLVRLSGAAALAVRFAGKVAEGLRVKRRQRERSAVVAERKRDDRGPVTRLLLAYAARRW